MRENFVELGNEGGLEMDTQATRVEPHKRLTITAPDTGFSGEQEPGAALSGRDPLIDGGGDDEPSRDPPDSAGDLAGDETKGDYASVSIDPPSQ